MRCVALILLTASTCLADAPNFDDQVAPILAAHCLDCHSGGDPKGKLDLSRKDTALRGGENGPAIQLENASESLLWQRVEADEMPPKKPLPAAEKKILQQWLASGGKWGSDPIDPYRVTSSSRAGYDWWSLRPVQRPTPPQVKSNAKHPIDRFIVARLEEQGLSRSPAADRRTLIRRLTFDLIGLPPTPEEVEAFVHDESEEAYATVVNRLLDSPHYGERWARHWLDVAHFGESDGYEYDRMRVNAWPYRDWVIESFNRDLPFDEFARLQIAGDVLHPNDPDAITAAGFLVHGAHDALLPAGDAMRQVMRQDELEDIVGLVGQSFLGLTVHCARCHDHKFDPILAADYYRLASSLAGVRRGDREAPARSIPPQLPEQLANARRELQQLTEAATRQVLAARGDKRAPQPSEALLRWDFEDAAVEKLKLEGNARLADGALILDGKQAYAVVPLEKGLRAKTLEAWVRLENLEQRGGGVLSIQTPDGGVFDAIVFGERAPGEWLAGSNFFERTKSFEGPAEQVANKEFVHLAITYAADGTITAYRNGEQYGKSYKGAGPVEFKAGQAQLLFGMRHSPPGGNKMVAGRIERAAVYDRALTSEEVANSAAAAGNVVTKTQLLAAMSAEERARYEQLTKHVEQLQEQLARLEKPQVYSVKPQQPEGPTHLLLRGNPAQKAEVVAPGGLVALKTISHDFQLDPTSPESERRKQLAAWITSDKNPLFARTIVNRLWHYHFGRGLIESPNDLGFNGGQPSHPELLDYLATELIEHGWSLKHLHRLMVSSAAYQQASLPRKECLAVDRDNRLLWRYSPRRLEAESIRDAALAISGELNPQMGGPSFHDFRPYVNHNSQYYEPLDPVGPEFHRRSIYRMWARGGKSPLLDTLDCPDPSTTTPKRGSTTTPLQALALLNNSFMLRMSDSLAARVKQESGDDVAAQVNRVMMLAYSRPANDRELELGLAFVKQHGLSPFCRVLLNTNGFLYVD